MRPIRFALVAFAAPALSVAQTQAIERTRPSPAPAHVAHGEVVAFARDLAAAREGDRVLVAWIDHTINGNSQLRTTLLRREGVDALVRARPDAPVTDAIRTPALAWNGHHGVLAWVVPPQRPPPRAVPGGPAVVRRPVVEPPPDETLGARARSGGDIVVQRLDAEGRPEGPARVVFHENSRLTRVALALDDGAVVLAWTGAEVTDDEVRDTIRVLRLDAALVRTTPMAVNAGFNGESGRVLTLTTGPNHEATLRASGTPCLSLHAEPPPALITADASVRVEAPNRTLMPQQPLHEIAGPPIVCDRPGLYETTFAPGAPMPPLRFIAPLASDLAADTVLSLQTATGPALVRIDHEAFHAINNGVALRPTAPPPRRAPDLTPRVNPPPGTNVPIVERPVPPPDFDTDDPFAAPRALDADATHVAVIDRTSRILAVRSGGQSTVLATSAIGFTSITLLPGTPAIALSREGIWNGPIRAWILDRPEITALSLPFATAVPVRAPRTPVTHPYVYDEAFARLWVRARTARAIFMRLENTAGALAARPEAPTDPRMPALLSQRLRLRLRWESACGGLMTRASQLSRQGAESGVFRGTQSLCVMHPDLVLGAPINPAL